MMMVIWSLILNFNRFRIILLIIGIYELQLKCGMPKSTLIETISLNTDIRYVYWLRLLNKR